MMGTEMKTPENSENILRNRKKKVKIIEKSSENEVKNEDYDDKKEKKKILVNEETNHNFKVIDKNENFVFRLEFDPMSIALLAIALATRFFRLSEPRNVV
jgi:hypothetical protein